MIPYRVEHIDRARAKSIEYLGTKRKYWFADPGDGRRMLFKAEERGTGEDWAEKIVCELAALLGVPHVHYDLAEELAEELDTYIPGVVCASLLEQDEALVHGNQLLLAADPNYPSDQKRFRVAAHTVDAVAEVVGRLGSPDTKWMTNVPEGVRSALDIFTGYLMLDALVANQDRHHQNWGAIRRRGSLCLAPSFDHGASLARNLSDEERDERLKSRDRNRQLPAFAQRARSAIYADMTSSRALTTIAAWQAFASRTPSANSAWIERLRAVDTTAMRGIIDSIPLDRLSAIGREFTLRLLTENKTRILNGDAA